MTDTDALQKREVTSERGTKKAQSHVEQESTITHSLFTMFSSAVHAACWLSRKEKNKENTHRVAAAFDTCTHATDSHVQMPLAQQLVSLAFLVKGKKKRESVDKRPLTRSHPHTTHLKGVPPCSAPQSVMGFSKQVEIKKKRCRCYGALDPRAVGLRWCPMV
jgi:hypothetical protein